MIYRCVEHYVSNHDITNIETDMSYCKREKQPEDIDIDCFICLDNSCTLFQLNELCFEYYKNCTCAGFVHRNCLHSWFTTSSNKCPICRNNMKKRIPVHIIIIENSRYYSIVFLQKLYIASYNAMYIFVYFIGVIHFIKMMIICYMLYLSIIENIEKMHKTYYANQDL